MTPPTIADITAALDRSLPPVDRHGIVVEDVRRGEVRLRLPFRAEFAGTDTWGASGKRIVSGPMMLGLADTAMFACALATYGTSALAIIQTMTTTFLRPAEAADLLAYARLVREGRRTAYLECYLRSAVDKDAAAHTTASYTIRHPTAG